LSIHKKVKITLKSLEKAVVLSWRSLENQTNFRMNSGYSYIDVI